jgi:hypothetical protein
MSSNGIKLCLFFGMTIMLDEGIRGIAQTHRESGLNFSLE